MGNHHSSSSTTTAAARSTIINDEGNCTMSNRRGSYSKLNPADCFGKRQSRSNDINSTGVPYTGSETFNTTTNNTFSSSSRLRLLVFPKRNRSNSLQSESASWSNSSSSLDERRRQSSGENYLPASYYQNNYNLGGKHKKSKTKSVQQQEIRNSSSPDLFSSSSSSETSPNNIEDQIRNNNSDNKGTNNCVTDNMSSQQSYNNQNVEKFAQLLAKLSSKVGSPGKKLDGHTITRETFQKYVSPHSPVLEKYLWDYYTGYLGYGGLKTATFVHKTEKLFAAITDKEQNTFYVKLFSRDKDTIDRTSFLDLLITSYQLCPGTVNDLERRDLSSGNVGEFNGKEWMESFTKSCFHIKETMSTFYVSNWLSTNLPRIYFPVHKYIVHQLTTGFTRLSNEKESPAKSETDGGAVASSGASSQTPEQSWSGCGQEQVIGIQPALMWLLTVSIPPVFLASLEKKQESSGQQVRELLRMQSKDLLTALMKSAQPKWTLLYDSDDHGLSLNRFQHHVFNYRGPTLMFLRCDNDYEILVGIDTEWKENCHFWGGQNCFVMQLKPEFRMVEKGDKCLYANFSIRGYPFGIQAGKDPRNVSVAIKADFEYVDFKKIPTRILNLSVWGCGSQDVKVAQAEQKKWEAKECEKQKKINLNAGDWSDNPDKYLLELAGNYKSYGS